MVKRFQIGKVAQAENLSELEIPNHYLTSEVQFLIILVTASSLLSEPYRHVTSRFYMVLYFGFSVIKLSSRE